MCVSGLKLRNLYLIINVLKGVYVEVFPQNNNRKNFMPLFLYILEI